MNSNKIQSIAKREYEFWQNERSIRRQANLSRKYHFALSPRSPKRFRRTRLRVDIRNKSCSCNDCGHQSKKLILKARIKQHRWLAVRRRFRSMVWAVVSVLAYKQFVINKAQNKKKNMMRRSTLLFELDGSPKQNLNSYKSRRVKLTQLSPRKNKILQSPSKQEIIKLDLIQYKINQARPIVRYVDNFASDSSTTKFSIQRSPKQVHSPVSQITHRNSTKNIYSDLTLSTTNKFRRYTDGEQKSTPKYSNYAPITELIKVSRHSVGMLQRSSKC